MKKIYIQSLTLLIALLISSFSYAQVAEAHTKSEIVKAISTELTRAAMDKNNRAIVSKATYELWKSVKHMSKKQTADFLAKLSKMSSANLSKLAKMSPRQLNSFAASAVSTLSKNTKGLRTIIAGANDQVGNAALGAASKIDDVIANGGKISKELVKKLKDAAKNLPPGRARAFLEYLKNKSVTDWKKITDLDTPGSGPGGVVGGVIDGVFVLFDAYDIYYSDDEPEIKAINATSKGIGYLAGAVATGFAGAASNATVTIAGGFLPGLIIALSADRVATLYKEIAMLQKERENAREIEENGRIDRQLFMIRQFISVSDKIKSGQIRNANSLLYKLDKYILDHSFENQEMLYELHAELEEKAENAERNQLINEAINTARHPYQKAANFYKKGVELHLAKIYAAEALTILNNNLKIYPEIGGLTAISKTQQLITAINEKIANAADFSITSVSAPERVYVGQSIDIPVFVTGGIPYYSSVGEIGSNTSDDSEVTMFWYASVVPGIEKFTITLKDCMGSTASTVVSIEVVEEIEEEDEEPVDVEYSDLKEFVDVNRDGIPYIFYSANKYHIGYSSDYANKTMYEDKENNEGFWVTGSSTKGGGASKYWYCLPHGPYRRYNIDDGKTLSITGFYNKGKKHGKWTHYASSGSRKGQVEYFTNFKNDLENGLETFYDSKGNISSAYNYKDGKKHGTQISYSSKIPGGILFEREESNGKVVSGYSWSSRKINGKIVSWIKRTNYSNGRSKEERYDENFKLSSSRFNDINGDEIKDEN